MRLTDLPGSEAKSASFREKRAPSSCNQLRRSDASCTRGRHRSDGTNTSPALGCQQIKIQGCIPEHAHGAVMSSSQMTGFPISPVATNPQISTLP
jgi:hypothetical protein